MVKRKKMPVFWKIYIAAAAILIVALGVWLFFLYGWLGDYEASQPKYVAEETFNKYFASFDAEQYVELCGIGEDSIETKESLSEYLKSVTDSKEINYKKVATGLDSGYKYIVVATGGEEEIKFASFKLSEKKSVGRFKSYEAGDFEIYTDSKNVVRIEAPKGYSVLVNGQVLSEKYITENDIPTDSCSHMPAGVSGIYFTEYAVKTLSDAPVIEITSGSGAIATVEMTGDNTYRAIPVYDSALSEEYSEWVLEAAELYARYTQYDEKVNVVGFNKVAPYFDPESELYESIKTMDNMFVQYYDSYEFTDKTASEFIKYDENTFSCRVKLTQVMYSGNDVYDDEIDMTLYVRNVDGEYLIYDMQVNVD